jgi:ferredoxin
MNQRRLKTIRVLLALLFVLATGFIFVDFRELFPDGLITGITFLQFLPSVLNFFTTFGLVAAGFILVLVLTALFGRFYCSAICPLGIFQDAVSWIRKKTKKKHRYSFGRPKKGWRYGFLVLPLLILLVGKSLIGISLLDPYSIFGRIASDLFQPVYMWLNNRIAGVLESMNVYFLYPEDITPARGLTYLIPGFMLGLVIWFSFTRGRLYCNTICPVGTLLGLLSRISVFKIRMIGDQCTKCGKCAIACKASCIRIKTLEVDFSRCVACYNCISVCPEDAIKYLPAAGSFTSFGPVDTLNPVDHADPADPSGPAAPSGPENPERRKALTRILATGAALSGFSLSARSQEAEEETETEIENKIPTEIEPVKNFPVTPPGSLGIRHFTTRCTACHLCVSVCPTSVLQPSLKEYGWSGILQPHMDYSTNYCNFECTLCADICPTGAILSLASEAKKTTQMGQVQLILENCVVYAENTACGSCSEHCPTQAVTMVPYREGLTLPEIIPEICVGCGACEYACPVRPFKAIFVDGHQIHQVAQEPPKEELEQPDLEEEFPF